VADAVSFKFHFLLPQHFDGSFPQHSTAAAFAADLPQHLEGSSPQHFSAASSAAGTQHPSEAGLPQHFASLATSWSCALSAALAQHPSALGFPQHAPDSFSQPAITKNNAATTRTDKKSVNLIVLAMVLSFQKLTQVSHAAI
jgi:hypothetical protein